jgi:hypothetical protein
VKFFTICACQLFSPVVPSPFTRRLPGA